MENATKALLIAAGVLLSIMILSLIVVFWDQMSAYFSAQHDAVIIKQIVEFNKKFDNYNGKTIRGSELLSVINRVVDYNNSEHDMIGYEPIIIEINFLGHQSDFLYNSDASNIDVIFKQGKITNKTGEPGKSDDTEIRTISLLLGNLISNSNTDGIPNITEKRLQELTAEISNIVDADNPKWTDDEKKAYEQKRDRTIKRILRYEELTDEDIDKVINAVKQYYQLMHFKRALFDCKEVRYNTENNRVNYIYFEARISEGHIESE